MKLKRISPYKLRRRGLKDGGSTLFLDLYHNGRHYYEPLDIQLLPESSQANRRANASLLAKAEEMIQFKTMVYLQNKAMMDSPENPADMPVANFVDMIATEYRKYGKAGARHLLTCADNLLRFRPYAVMRDINVEFCRDYSIWLRKSFISRRGKPLAPMTAHVYFRKFGLVLSHAMKRGLINRNPWCQLHRNERIPEPRNRRRFLTREEIDRLEKTSYNQPDIRRAFLFACFCGLRISDVINLRWGAIERKKEATFLTINMKKTGRPLSIPLSENALRHLPKRGEEQERVFPGLPSMASIERHLREWAQEAGVKGNIHFHVSRHTFATLMITAGVDIYLLSKLLGHSDIRTTGIYAQIVNEKKTDAINKLDNFLANNEVG